MASATLELSADELDLLCDVLDSTIGDLSPEIADTDNPSYRRNLKARPKAYATSGAPRPRGRLNRQLSVPLSAL